MSYTSSGIGYWTACFEYQFVYDDRSFQERVIDSMKAVSNLIEQGVV